ncbi:hypothetical protein BJX76DRAFT_357404 [Aspergillus varians]
MSSQISRPGSGEVDLSAANTTSITFGTTEEAVFGTSVAEQRLPKAHPQQGRVEDADGVPEEHHDQITLDGPDEPHVEERLREAISTPFQIPHTSQAGEVLSGLPEPHCSPALTEPFPDFESSQVEAPSTDFRALEDIYNYAMSKVAELIKREKEINNILIAIRGPLFSVNHYESVFPPRPSISVMNGVTQCSAPSHHNHFCARHEDEKLRLRTEMQNFLQFNSKLPPSFQKRVWIICNMVIDLEFMFFRAKGFPKDPVCFISSPELVVIHGNTAQILGYFTKISDLIRTEKNDVERTRDSVAQVAAMPGLSLLQRFRRISEIIMKPKRYLRQVRPTEKTFFEFFLEFYEGFVYNDFHIMHNNYLVDKGTANIPSVWWEASYHLSEISGILHDRIIPDFTELRDITAEIGQSFLLPVIDELCQGPCMCPEIQAIRKSPLVAEIKHARLEELTGSILARQDQLPSDHESQSDIPPHVPAQSFASEDPSSAHTLESRVVDAADLSPADPSAHGSEHYYDQWKDPLYIPLLVDGYYQPEDDSLEFPLQSSCTTTAQGSSSGNNPVQHHGASFQGFEPEYAPTEIMTSFEIAEYPARAIQANPSHCHSPECSQLINFSNHRAYPSHALHSRTFQRKRLQAHTTRTHPARDIQSPSTQPSLASPQKQPHSEQDLNLSFDMLDLTTKEDEWLPHNHDMPGSYPTGTEKGYVNIETFTTRVEKMAQSCIFKDNNITPASLPSNFRFHSEPPSAGPYFRSFRARRPSSSSSIARNEFPHYETAMRAGRRAGSESDSCSPALPLFSGYGSVVGGGGGEASVVDRWDRHMHSFAYRRASRGASHRGSWR